ncbi:lipid-A-disaccharide synthase [Hahella sp. CCB-MM4]|uniref:lipid-A-disaccharide synthase n=1 Tax=Hahella sp. (strain CCB-MM4) TaxID=1926491 RepID=UPI000B9A4D87|nr:lipid-A-disaccharide synthase [Hahella sp. CCB-MM4]OZG70571.1 lipid-A-disaccharide synthase [Hahella sp. CCB-MM4]
MPDPETPLLIGIIAGEASGDLLGAGLIRELKKLFPSARFEGIGGPQMMAEGFNSLFPMERLSIMGLVEVLGRLPELFSMRRQLLEHFTSRRPAVFIGIDAPDFNIGVELRLRAKGIKTAHYVSPSVWAWRQNRIFKIARAVDLMLTLLPFEAGFYRQHKVPVQFVGHPLAEMMPLHPVKAEARERLGVSAKEGQIIAVLPGSRGGEVKMLGPVFIQTMLWLHKRRPQLTFLLPAANPHRKKQIQMQLEQAGVDLPLIIMDGHSRDVMQAADSILMASGTATLEAMLAKRPMVVAYKMAPLTYWIMKRLLKAKYISLPNLLADEALVPELIQHNANPQSLGKAVLASLQPEQSKSLEKKFTDLHLQIKQDADKVAAESIAKLIQSQFSSDTAQARHE